MLVCIIDVLWFMLWAYLCIIVASQTAMYWRTKRQHSCCVKQTILQQ